MLPKGNTQSLIQFQNHKSDGKLFSHFRWHPAPAKTRRDELLYLTQKIMAGQTMMHRIDFNLSATSERTVGVKIGKRSSSGTKTSIWQVAWDINLDFLQCGFWQSRQHTRGPAFTWGGQLLQSFTTTAAPWKVSIPHRPLPKSTATAYTRYYCHLPALVI